MKLFTTVTHTFKKRPFPKNLANRSISFAATGEIDHVGSNDLVIIEIQTKSGVTKIEVAGSYFLKNLQTKTAKKSGTKVLVYKF